jgi:hypothetical protein
MMTAPGNTLPRGIRALFGMLRGFREVVDDQVELLIRHLEHRSAPRSISVMPPRRH